MDLALEQRVYKVEHHTSEKLRLIADELGFVRAGPRDVAEIHSRALKQKRSEVSLQKFQAYVEEGRLTVLELMGYLASYYRLYSSAFTRPTPQIGNEVRMSNETHKEKTHE